MIKRYSLCEQVLSGDIFDKYPTGIHDKDTSKILRYPELIDLLNKQDLRIQELEDKLENWKQLATVAQSENSILHNELGIAIEQGYTLSDAFKEYKKGVVTDDRTIHI